jgi:lysozyme family protein
MTASNFPAELTDELVYEGGYVDDPRDPGGMTDFGITLATLSAFLGRSATKADLTGMSAETKLTIYRREYWDAIDGDALPSGLDLCVFDMAVNGGPARAIKMLQYCVGADEDGVMGPQTLGLVNAATDMMSLMLFYTVQRVDFYRSLPGYPTFGNGWLARVASVKRQALALLA